MENQLNCIYSVINFVEKHYGQPIAIKELEDISHYSATSSVFLNTAVERPLALFSKG